MAKIPQEHHFLFGAFKILQKKVKQFVRKYYITSLTWLTNYDIEKFLVSSYAMCY